MAPSDNFLFLGAIFKLKKNTKKENRLCLLPYEEALEASIKAVFGQNNVGIFKN